MTTNYKILNRDSLGVSVQDTASYNAHNREFQRLLHVDKVLCQNKSSNAYSNIDYSVNVGYNENIVSIPCQYSQAGTYQELKNNNDIALYDRGAQSFVVTYSSCSSFDDRKNQFALTENSILWKRVSTCATLWGEWEPVSASSVVSSTGDTMTGCLNMSNADIRFNVNQFSTKITGDYSSCSFRIVACDYDIIKYDATKNKIILGCSLQNQEVYLVDGNSKIWNECNMGDGGGLNADKLDGKHLSELNFQNPLSFGGFLEVIPYTCGTAVVGLIDPTYNSAIVYVTGGGASGQSAGNDYFHPGGGAGATVIGNIIVDQCNLTYSAIVGNRGKNSTPNTPYQQVAGKTSTFTYGSTVFTAEGGKMANQGDANAYGGWANINGRNTFYNYRSEGSLIGGAGNNSYWGEGGRINYTQHPEERNGIYWGAGGSGGYGDSGVWVGGDGAEGVIVIHWFK